MQELLQACYEVQCARTTKSDSTNGKWNLLLWEMDQLELIQDILDSIK